MPEEQPSVVKKALLNNKVNALHSDITNIRKIVYQKATYPGWGALILSSGDCRVDWNNDDKPYDANFAHELLHLKLQLDGFCRYTNIGGEIRKDQVEEAKQLLIFLDQVFQHAKMIGPFLSMNFSKSFFYGSHDRDPSGLTNRYLKGKTTKIGLAMAYMNSISPGGSITRKNRGDLVNAVLAKAGSNFEPCKEKIDKCLAEWEAQESLDHRDHLRTILRELVDFREMTIGPHGAIELGPDWFQV